MREFMAAAALAVIAVFVIMWAIRLFNNAATSITVNEVEPGIHCALATSTDGVAIDCWEVDEDG